MWGGSSGQKCALRAWISLSCPMGLLCVYFWCAGTSGLLSNLKAFIILATQVCLSCSSALVEGASWCDPSFIHKYLCGFLSHIHLTAMMWVFLYFSIAGAQRLMVTLELCSNCRKCDHIFVPHRRILCWMLHMSIISLYTWATARLYVSVLVRDLFDEPCLSWRMLHLSAFSTCSPWWLGRWAILKVNSTGAYGEGVLLGCRYSLTMHHTADELHSFGLTDIMIADQEW